MPAASWPTIGGAKVSPDSTISAKGIIASPPKIQTEPSQT